MAKGWAIPKGRYDEMKYKGHNKSNRARIRRKYVPGYWVPKWARIKKRDKLSTEKLDTLVI